MADCDWCYWCVCLPSARRELWEFPFLHFVLFIICHLGNQRIRRRHLQSAD